MEVSCGIIVEINNCLKNWGLHKYCFHFFLHRKAAIFNWKIILIDIANYLELSHRFRMQKTVFSSRFKVKNV